MGKPTSDELKMALSEAGDMREHDNDPNYVAKSLLSLNYQNRQLEKVYRCAENYIHSGNGIREHTLLIKALDEYKYLDLRSSGKEASNFSLG